MPGMQAAFVEIGLERAAFLHASDIVRPHLPLNGENGDNVPAAAPVPTPPISELVHDGQEIVVQVVKDPIGTKGARLTTQLSIPSRYLVLLPYSRVLGVSVRIEDEAERTRLKDMLAELRRRDASRLHRAHQRRRAAREALAEDIDYLGKLWTTVQDRHRARQGRRARSTKTCRLPLRALRDLMRADDREGARRFARNLRAHARVRRSSSCPSWPTASSITPASGRSSTCTASRTRSSARCARTCR